MRPKGYCVEVEFIISTSKIGAFYISEISLGPAPKLITLNTGMEGISKYRRCEVALNIHWIMD